MTIEYVNVIETPTRLLSDMILTPDVLSVCRDLIKEQDSTSILRAHNIEPRHRVMLSGTTGTGKSALAEVLAAEIGLPMFVVRYELLIGSYLWETASRLVRLFERVAQRRCLLFFDEFGLLGNDSEGAVAVTLSRLLDNLPSHVVVVMTTHDPSRLNSGISRRFQVRIKLDKPTREQRLEWLARFERRIGRALEESERLSLMIEHRSYSFADLEEICAVLQRQHLL